MRATRGLFPGNEAQRGPAQAELERRAREARREQEEAVADAGAILGSPQGRNLLKFLRKYYVEAPMSHLSDPELRARAGQHDLVLELEEMVRRGMSPMEAENAGRN